MSVKKFWRGAVFGGPVDGARFGAYDLPARILASGAGCGIRPRIARRRLFAVALLGADGVPAACADPSVERGSICAGPTPTVPPIYEIEKLPCRSTPPTPMSPYADPDGYFGRPIAPRSDKASGGRKDTNPKR